MKQWNERPREIRTLFNPAFCGLVLARGIQGYMEKATRPMPFSLTLLILPLVLHKGTREKIKGNPSYLTKIVEDHPELRVGLAQRARGLMPYMMEAFGYLLHAGVIVVDANGAIAVKEGTVKKTISGSQDTKDCQSAAQMLGKKFAALNDRITIYTMFGIRP